VYAYAFGELLVMALYEQYLRDGPDFVPKYLAFLGSGGKAKPEELLRPFGVDLADAGFWDRGMRILEELVNEAEREALR
jgi:oligoendopeptidase F